MRIEITCSKCSEQIALGESGVVHSLVCSMCDDGIYEFKCPQGHHTTTVLRTPKHEVLYTIGANAFLDGYFRDGIASFAGALERYYEFALKVIARHKNIDKFDDIWKSTLKLSSERQFGAFAMVWMMETGKPYTQLSKKKIDQQSKLRNEVIHQGKIPTSEECLSYGQYVLDVIAPIEKLLLSDYAVAHKDECFALSKDVRKQKTSPITVLSIFSVFGAAIKDNNKLEPVISRLDAVRKLHGISSVEAALSKSQIVTHQAKNS